MCFGILGKLSKFFIMVVGFSLRCRLLAIVVSILVKLNCFIKGDRKGNFFWGVINVFLILVG